jgi:thioredoxin 1|tara:strand:+ start:755 stop:1072 length:318 start_codon:yes stop_codon:yes gene_type:complete
MVLEVTDEKVAEVLNTDKVVVLDFWAEWCGPCRMYGPILEEFSNEFPDVVVGKVNVDKANEVAKQYGIRNIPTTIVFRNGEVINKVSGVVTKQKLSELVGLPDIS